MKNQVSGSVSEPMSECEKSGGFMVELEPVTKLFCWYFLSSGSLFFQFFKKAVKKQQTANKTKTLFPTLENGSFGGKK